LTAQPTNSLLKIHFPLATDSSFGVNKSSLEVIRIACGALRWSVPGAGSCSSHQISQSAQVVGRSCKGEQPSYLVDSSQPLSVQSTDVPPSNTTWRTAPTSP